jgi:hypothetical protein
MKIITATILLALTLVRSFAQNAPLIDPPELAAKREEHIRDLQRVSIPVLQQYLRTLDGLREQFSREGRQDALKAVAAESEKVRQEVDTSTKAADRSNTTSLHW